MNTALPAASQIIDFLKNERPVARHFFEQHHTLVTASAATILDSIGLLEQQPDPLTQRLITLREYPARLLGKIGWYQSSLPDQSFGLDSFTDLGREGDKACAFGLIGRFWRLDFGLEPLSSAKQFFEYYQPGVPKLVMSFLVSPRQDGIINLQTRTDVFCYNRASAWMFTPYWLVIRLASGWIRRRLLRQIKQQAERVAGC